MQHSNPDNHGELGSSCSPLGPGPVVIVDDDPIDLEVMARSHAKSALGNELLTFSDGPTFLEHLDGLAPDATLPVVVLLDINMPLMTGFEVLERMRAMERFHHLPAVVFLSNSDSPRDARRAHELGSALQQKFVRIKQCVEFFDELAA